MKSFRLFTALGSRTMTGGMSVALPADKILANDVVFPEEFNPGNFQLWLCLNAHGPMGAVWARSMEDALDVLVDANLAGGILVDESSPDEEHDNFARLGSRGQVCDLSDTRVEKVAIIPDRDWKLMVKLAEARGAGHDNLNF